MENIEFTIQEKSKRGRKKKYATPEEARKAKLAQTKASNMKKKQSKKQSKKKNKKGGKILPPTEDYNEADDPAYGTDETGGTLRMTLEDGVLLNDILSRVPRITTADYDNYLQLIIRYEDDLRSQYEDFLENIRRAYEITNTDTPAERQERLGIMDRTRDTALSRMDMLVNFVNRHMEARRRERAREETARENMGREDTDVEGAGQKRKSKKGGSGRRPRNSAGGEGPPRQRQRVEEELEDLFDTPPPTPPTTPEFDAPDAFVLENILTREPTIRRTDLMEFQELMNIHPNMKRSFESFLRDMIREDDFSPIIMERAEFLMRRFEDFEDRLMEGFDTPPPSPPPAEGVAVIPPTPPTDVEGGAVWRGATDPVFLEHYLKMKAEAEKNGAGIFDYVKGFYDYAKRQIGSQVADTIDFVKDPIGATKRKAEKRQEYIKAVVFGATKLPPKAREILAQYGDTPITEIMVARNPVGSLLTGALNAVSLGDFKKKFKKLPYDKLYHLYMWLKVGDQNITLEKNEAITMDIDASIRAGSDTMKVPIPAGLTLNNMLANTEKEMGGKFLKYSAYNNNCQDFIMAVLKSNGLGDDAIYSFVKQDTKSLFSDNSFLRKVSNTITDVGARVNTAIFGAGSKKGGMMAGEETPPPQNAEENNAIGRFTLQLLNMRNRRLINLNRLMREGLLRNFQLTIPELRNIFENWLGGAYNPQEIARFMTRFDRIANATSNYVGENSDDSDIGGYGIKKPIKKDLAKIKSAVKEKTMPNKWITFVKDYASSNGMSYRDALKDPNCKAQYKSGAGFFEDIADGVKAVFGGGMPTNEDAYIAEAYDATQLGANAGKRKSK